MPTTRHHLNNQRRRQAREALHAPVTTDTSGSRETPRIPPSTSAPQARGTLRTAVTANLAKRRGEPRDQLPPAPRRRTLVALCLLTLVLGGFAGWAHARTEALRDTPAARNTALSDTARTSEIKGQSTKAVAGLFSYDHADPRALDRAARQWLTGRAVAQHRDLLGDLRTRADKQKAVITTTVTDSAVERIDGDRARVLVYADQSSVSTAGGKKAEDDGTYAGAMFAVDVQRRDGRWLVSGIDTFSR
ncbi:hypothetical protein ACOBQB_00835 [Streptomyces sp. G5(2025)]|uniref:hypothetical protein n=1 Tax=Streptomyces sp. G5(2025) TaxID=3406628 RepID=UPI003C1DA48A